MLTIKNGHTISLITKTKIRIKKDLHISIFQRIRFSLRNKLTQENSTTNQRMKRKKQLKMEMVITTNQKHQLQAKSRKMLKIRIQKSQKEKQSQNKTKWLCF